MTWPLYSYVCRISTHFAPSDRGDPVDVFYQQYTRDISSPPVSKRAFAQAVKKFHGCESVLMTREGKRVRGYKNFQLKADSGTHHNYVSAQLSADCYMVPTGDIKDGSPVAFLVKQNGENKWGVELFGKTMSFVDLGVSYDCPVENLKLILSRAHICKGYIGKNNTVIWTRVDNTTKLLRTVAPMCRLIAAAASSFCEACRHHKQYNKVRKPTAGNEENEVDSSPTPHTSTPTPDISALTTHTSTPQVSTPTPHASTPTPHVVTPTPCTSSPTFTSPSTKQSHAENVADLSTILTDIGINSDKALLMAESVHNEMMDERRQRRWSER